MPDGDKPSRTKQTMRTKRPRITRQNRAAVIFLIQDRSPSPKFLFWKRHPSGHKPFSDFLDLINSTIDRLLDYCIDGYDIRDYFAFSCFGYRTHNSNIQLCDLLRRSGQKQLIRSASVMNRTRNFSIDEMATHEIIEENFSWAGADNLAKKESAVSINNVVNMLSRWFDNYPNSFVFMFHLTDSIPVREQPLSMLRELKDKFDDHGEFLVVHALLDKNEQMSLSFPSVDRPPSYDTPWKILLNESSIPSAEFSQYIMKSTEPIGFRTFCLATNIEEMKSFIFHICESMPWGTEQAWNEDFRTRQNLKRETSYP